MPEVNRFGFREPTNEDEGVATVTSNERESFWSITVVGNLLHLVLLPIERIVRVSRGIEDPGLARPGHDSEAEFFNFSANFSSNIDRQPHSQLPL